MIVTAHPSNLSLPSSAPRGKGIHLSGIVRAIAFETGVLDKKWKSSPDAEVDIADFKEITDPDAIVRMAIGLAWEEWYIPNILAAEGVMKHPGEMRVDGIYMTPDGESMDVIITSNPTQNRHIIHEIKTTAKSTNTVGDLSTQWMWLAQMKGYCKGAKTTHARLHCLFLHGDYKFPIRPQLRIWDVEFTQQEIDEHWDLITSYRDERA